MYLIWGPSVHSASIIWAPSVTVSSTRKGVQRKLSPPNWSPHVPASVPCFCLLNQERKWLIWKPMPSLEWPLIKSDLNWAGLAEEAASLHCLFLEAPPTWGTSGCGAPVWPSLSGCVRCAPGEMASVLKGYSCLRRCERVLCVRLPPKPPSAVCHQKCCSRPYLATDRNGFQTFPGKWRYLASRRWFVISLEVRFWVGASSVQAPKGHERFCLFNCMVKFFFFLSVTCPFKRLLNAIWSFINNCSFQKKFHSRP